MAIEIQETFRVAAPIEKVWQFIMAPQNVVDCMPGASLTRIVDDRSFVGAVKLKIGAVSAQYQGTITYTEADWAQHLIKMLAEGNERGGGTVSGTIATQLVAVSPAETEVRCTSSIDLTGRIVQVGRGMIEGVSAQIIKKYVANVRAMLEVPEAQPAAGAAAAETAGTAQQGSAPAGQGAAAKPRVQAEDSINIVAIVLKVMRDRVAAFFRRLFRSA